MLNKEQLLYFFLQGKISLSQYDYKFMANLQSIIQNKDRITSNQAMLFDNLIQKYKKQLSKNNLFSDMLGKLEWKTRILESTIEYTGATVSLNDDTIVIRVPFNKRFISRFKSIDNNSFTWDKETKSYHSKFSTTSLKITYTELKKYFDPVMYDEQLTTIIKDIEQHSAEIYNPTLKLVNGRPMIIAINSVLNEQVKDIDLRIDMPTLNKLTNLGIHIDSEIYKDDSGLEFASKRVYTVEFDEVEKVISYMSEVGCKEVLLGRGLKSNTHIEDCIKKYNMSPVGIASYDRKYSDGTCIVIQHTSIVTNSHVSKTIIVTDSRPIEVK